MVEENRLWLACKKEVAASTRLHMALRQQHLKAGYVTFLVTLLCKDAIGSLDTKLPVQSESL